MRARAGETVLIPGSMGTASYVAEGLGNPEAFATCQHRAGRAISRTAARKSKTSGEVYDEMAALGVSLLSGDPKTVAEEAAFALTTPSGVSRRTGRTRDVDAAMTASMSLRWVRASRSRPPER